MPIYRVKAHTGPAGVTDYAEMLATAGYSVLVGTQQIFVDSKGMTPKGAAWNAQVDIDHRLHFIPCGPDPVQGILLRDLSEKHLILHPEEIV